MSVSAEIFTFPGRNGGGNGGAWGNQDLADIYRCIDLFARHGVVLEGACGLTDEGDPWFALEDVASGETLVHIARIDGFFIVHVLDGETWQGDTLRAALANLDLNALVLGDPHVPADHGHDGTDNKTDPDGSHAFLRIVSAVIAVLTADVIASTVAHDAMASPLPDVSETVAGDHAFKDNSHTFALPELHEAEKVNHHPGKEPAPDAALVEPMIGTPQVAEPAKAGALLAAEEAPAAHPSSATPIDLGDILMLAEAAPTVKVDVAAPQHLIALESLLPQAGDHPEILHLIRSDKVVLSATEKDDLFLVVLTPQQERLQVAAESFQSNHDSLVVEKSTPTSTSSGIILDLSQLPAQTGGLTMIGQLPAGDVPLSGG
ncbi:MULTISPECIES: hypothetical protein [unclassified Azospirillum]|uniref:hypothetical protein n=1 Tax=unclassified Azospirillum TaxID=2630922 RepID=UPI000B760FD0|nr:MULTISPECIES: hypothetical protein [unclassified Azospirillum]SNS68960.1 hypothetical protein SAMN05880556_109131 [Azospirillum sp. RU38E]SNS87081.1 hypothetical protein SAMN05880591_109131 [Azospirillum sp. RU37A]